MYRACIFCWSALGANESIEHFPVGRSLAFDAAKGRLWVVCPRCARWNLAPLHERWEAVEEAERRFRDTRVRVQSENVGLTKLRDGTRLIRIGRALPGELAVWRYGRIMQRRRAAAAAAVGVTVIVPAGMITSMAVGFAGAAAVFFLLTQGLLLAAQWRPRLQSRSLLPYSGLDVDGFDFRAARLAFTFEGQVGLELEVPEDEVLPGLGSWRDGVLVLNAENARTVLRRGMLELNAAGAGRDRVQAAVNLLAASGSAEMYLRRGAADRIPVDDHSADRWVRGTRRLALEMAVHDELEREALRGELAALEAAWRQAEEIAGIADWLPDDPPPEPPRLDGAS
jgi:hypothetical protein